MVFDHIKALIKRRSTTNSIGADYAFDSGPSSFSAVSLHQYPFPTNPEVVRKSRHYNHPRYLPPPEASVRDVRHFLYTLLTSRNNDCAKEYPEWVIETCIAWDGTGETLRNCSHRQLTTLCPYVATAVGIKSKKHKEGAFVPIPARHMIGDVVARFVAGQKASERRPSEVHYRLNKERTRSSSALGNHFILQPAQPQSMVNTPTTELLPGEKRFSVQSALSNHAMSYSNIGSTPTTEILPGDSKRFSVQSASENYAIDYSKLAGTPTTVPHWRDTQRISLKAPSAKRRSYMTAPLPSKWVASNEVVIVRPSSHQKARSASSSGMVPKATTNTMPPPPRHSWASSNQPLPTFEEENYLWLRGSGNRYYDTYKGRYVDAAIDAAILREKHYKAQKKRAHDEKRKKEEAERERQEELQAEELRKEPWWPETVAAQTPRLPPKRYRVPCSASSNTVPQRMNPANDATRKDSNFHPLARWSNFMRRRSTMSVPISLAIPEESAEQLKSLPENMSTVDDRLRHDSGAHSLSHSPVPSMKKVAKSAVQPTSTSLGPDQVASQTRSAGSDAVEHSTPVPTASDDSDNDFTVGLKRTPVNPVTAGTRSVVATVTRARIAAFEAGLLKGKGKAFEPTEQVEEPQNQKKAQPTSLCGQLQSIAKESLFISPRPSSSLSARSGGSMNRAVEIFDIMEEDQRNSGPSSTIRRVL